MPLRSYPLAAAARPRARPRGRGHRPPARVGRVRRTSSRATWWARRARAAVQPRADGAGRLAPRRREQPRGGGGRRPSASRRSTARSLTLTPRRRPADRRVERAFQGRAGSAVALDPRDGRDPGLTSTPGLRSEHVLDGASSRRSGASCSQRPGEAADEPRDPGPVRRRAACSRSSTALAALEEGVDHARARVPLPGLPLDLRHRVPLPQAARATARWTCGTPSPSPATSTSTTSASGSRSSGIARYAQQAGPGRAHRHRPAARGARPRPGPEWKHAHAAGCPGSRARRSRCPSARARSRSRRCSWRGSWRRSANGGKLVTPHLVKALGGQPVPAPPPRGPRLRRPTRWRPCRRGCARGERAGHRAGARGWRASRCAARPARRRSSPTPGWCATGSGVETMQPHGWFVGFAPGRAAAHRAGGAGGARRRRRRGGGAGGARDPGRASSACRSRRLARSRRRHRRPRSR